MDAIKTAGYETTVITVFTNGDDYEITHQMAADVTRNSVTAKAENTSLAAGSPETGCQKRIKCGESFFQIRIWADVCRNSGSNRREPEC